MTLALGVGGVASAAPVITSAPANLPPTPAFTAAWNTAQAAFAHCQYLLAYKRYRAAKPYGVRLADPALRFRFDAGLAFATYAAGYKPTARSYADTAGGIYDDQFTGEQQRLATQIIIQLIDIRMGNYYPTTPSGSSDVAICKSGENSPF